MAKAIPALKFLAAAEIAMLTRRHLALLEPAERRRLLQLLAKRQRSPSERDELGRLAGKARTRAFAGNAVDALSPIPLPRIVREGRRRRR
jgi:hypothetical protein